LFNSALVAQAGSVNITPEKIIFVVEIVAGPTRKLVRFESFKS
jgi:hypothetical protein